MKTEIPYFLTNPEWYTTGEDGIGYKLTDKAPKEAQKSYEEFYKEVNKNRNID